MTATQLIKKLQEIVKSKGDSSIYYPRDDWSKDPVDEIQYFPARVDCEESFILLQ